MIDLLLSTNELIVALGAGLAVLFGWIKVVRPRIRAARQKVAAAQDAILGRDARFDTITGQQIQPALPGIGVRMEHQEQQTALLANAVSKIADSHQRLENHESRISALEQSRAEQVVTRMESAEAWRAVANIAENGESDI